MICLTHFCTIGKLYIILVVVKQHRTLIIDSTEICQMSWLLAMKRKMKYVKSGCIKVCISENCVILKLVYCSMRQSKVISHDIKLFSLRSLFILGVYILDANVLIHLHICMWYAHFAWSVFCSKLLFIDRYGLSTPQILRECVIYIYVTFQY